VIFEFWQHHRAALSLVVAFDEQWLDGSFVTAIENPGDADLVTILNHAAVDALPEPEQILLAGLVSGRPMKEICRCDSYFVVEYPVGHPAHAVFQGGLRYWDNLFSQVRGSSTQKKGFVVVAA
jgi:hypothetical protein